MGIISKRRGLWQRVNENAEKHCCTEARPLSLTLQCILGIAVCGSGVGCFAFAPLANFLLEEYGWQGANMIFAALCLNCAIFGALMRPLELVITLEEEVTTKFEIMDNGQNEDIIEEVSEEDWEQHDQVPEIQKVSIKPPRRQSASLAIGINRNRTISENNPGFGAMLWRNESTPGFGRIARLNSVNEAFDMLEARGDANLFEVANGHQKRTSRSRSRQNSVIVYGVQVVSLPIYTRMVSLQFWLSLDYIPGRITPTSSASPTSQQSGHRKALIQKRYILHGKHLQSG